MIKAKPKIVGASVNLDPKPKGEFKDVGGSQQDVWNLRLANLVISTLPDYASEGASTAAISAMADMKPADPIEGILIGQIIAAMRRRCQLIGAPGLYHQSISMLA